VIRRVAAHFVLGLRAPWRSRLVAALLVLLAATVLVLPAHLHSDGTPAGELRMLLTWTLGPAMAILAAASLWAGCAAISPEVWDKRYASAAVTPARPFEAWLGRWLGIVAIDAALLAAVLLAVGAQVARRVPAEATAVRARLAADPASLDAEARRIFDDLPAEVRAAVDEPKAIASIRRDLAGDSFLPVAPGLARGWAFLLPDPAPEEAEVRFQFMSSYGSLQGAKGALSVSADGRPVMEVPVSNDDPGFVSAALPAGALRGAKRLAVEFRNGESADGGASVLLRQSDSLRVLVPAGGLAANLVRAFLALLAPLALLAALGVALGCGFSFPVAAFLATAIVAMAIASGGSAFRDSFEGETHHHGEARAETRLDRALKRFSLAASDALRATTAPIDRTEALDRLGDGIAVEGRAALAALALDGLALPLLLGLLGGLALRARCREMP
jgi:hypothetical protein